MTELPQGMLKSPALGHLAQLHEPKVASSDSTDSVVAFPSRHLQGANEQQDSARDEHSLDSLPARSKPSGQRMVKVSRGAAALPFLQAAGSALKGAGDAQDPYWSGLSDADIARHKSLGG